MPQTRRFVPDSGRLLALLAVIVLGVLTTVGSGGGGGGGGSTAPTSLTYTGVTTPAAVDQSNAQTLVAAALQGGSAGTLVTGAVELPGPAARSGEPRVIGLVDLLKGSLERIDFTLAGGTTVSGTLVPYSETIPSPYGTGSLILSFTYDDQTGSFSGTATYNNYCEDADSCVNGESGFSGQLDLTVSPPELESAQFTFPLLSVTDNGIAYQMSGAIGMIVQSPTQTQVTMSAVIGDSSGTYKIDNYVYLVTDYTTYVEVAQSAGRFYHPTYGYVEVKTLASLLYHLVSNVVATWPYQGEFEIDGASSTKALLTALSDDVNVTPQWQLQLDNGSGVLLPLSSGDWVDL